VGEKEMAMIHENWKIRDEVGGERDGICVCT